MRKPKPIVFSAVVAALLSLASSRADVVNMSHYDTIVPNFGAFRSGGASAVIHEATFPLGETDDHYARRQMDALHSGLLWGAYHFGDASDGVRQADRFLDVVASNWTHAEGRSRELGVLLVLDFEKTHYK